MQRANKIQIILYLTNFFGLTGLLVVGFLSNLILINGYRAGELAENYNPNFQFADYSSSFWILIYSLLVAFVIFLFDSIKNPKGIASLVSAQLGLTFFVTCLVNAAWILSWHYDNLITSVILISILLLSLIDINKRVRKIERELDQVSASFRWLVKVPFGLYLGWVCIVMIANITLFFSATGWEYFNFSSAGITILLMVFIGVLGLYLMRWLKTYAPAIAIAWGLFGILSIYWQNGSNPFIQIAALLMISLLGIGAERQYQEIESIRSKQ